MMHMKSNKEKLLPAGPALVHVDQVVEALDRSGPALRLDARLSEIQTGLGSLHEKLEQRSSTVSQAEDTQKVRGDGDEAPPPGPGASVTLAAPSGIFFSSPVTTSAHLGRAGRVALASGKAGGRRSGPGEA